MESGVSSSFSQSYHSVFCSVHCARNYCLDVNVQCSTRCAPCWTWTTFSIFHCPDMNTEQYNPMKLNFESSWVRRIQLAFNSSTLSFFPINSLFSLCVSVTKLLLPLCLCAHAVSIQNSQWATHTHKVRRKVTRQIVSLVGLYSY